MGWTCPPLYLPPGFCRVTDPCVERNRPALCEDVKRLFGDESALAKQKLTRADTLEKDHGRIETRRAVALDGTALLGGLRDLAAGVGVQSLTPVEAHREPSASLSACVLNRSTSSLLRV